MSLKPGGRGTENLLLAEAGPLEMEPRRGSWALKSVRPQDGPRIKLFSFTGDACGSPLGLDGQRGRDLPVFDLQGFGPASWHRGASNELVTIFLTAVGHGCVTGASLASHTTG